MKAQTVAEIAGVMAHEMAHVERRHSLKSITGSLGKLLGFAVLSIFFGSDSASLVAKGSNFASLGYSREDETEADQRGLEFSRNSAINPRGLISFFERLQKEQTLGDKVDSMLTLLSTHPASDDRVKNLEFLIKEKPFTSVRKLDFQLKDFQLN